MSRIYEHILYDEYGESIPLSTDDFIDYLIQTIQQFSSEKRILEKQLSDIAVILNPPIDPALPFDLY